MSIKEIRWAAAVDFSIPYYQTPYRFVARKGAGIEISDAGLKGKKVGVYAGATQDKYLQAKYAGIVEPRGYENIDQITADLVAGRIDLSFNEALAQTTTTQAGTSRSVRGVEDPGREDLPRGDALAERLVGGEAVVQVDRVGVARHAGEGGDVGFRHGLAEHRRHADLEVFQVKAVHGRKGVRRGIRHPLFGAERLSAGRDRFRGEETLTCAGQSVERRAPPRRPW